ncbi:MAG: hypothetical protein CM15mP6_3620 [Methanobacteriota archaeon]|nr:MAG: hypothetical protein CM15mP6_3620 [Euryarchaeota archaeon]
MAGLASFSLNGLGDRHILLIPMIVLERPGSRKHGQKCDLFKRTWGEDVTSHIGTGF